MKGTLTTLKNKALSIKDEAYCTLAAAMVGAYPITNEAFAGAGSAGAILQKITHVIAHDVLPLIGGVLVLLGVFKLIMAIRNDQPEAQASAARDIVIGAVVVVFGIFLWDPISSMLFG